LPRIEEDGGSWLRRPKLYKRVVEPHKKKKKVFEIRAVDEIIWKNTVEAARPRVTVWRMRIAYWIPEATDTYSEYMIGLFISFPLQQRLHDCASTYVIRALPFFLLLKIDRGRCTLLVGFMWLKHKV
jgi:hypothetical protein